ncbi:pentapeptide repeat-containing protein [Sphaerothrix gracilis]|uniref:pentapeptide repeat-containing protein n=1 Tax=Sphaerothrix gracilis TaxID=3151835 RepID=UPI0031FE0E60
MRWKPFKAHHHLEKCIQTIPAWLAVTISVVCLAVLALWVNEIPVDSIQTIFSREALQILFSEAESIAIVAAVILYFKGAPDRKAQKHYEAWRVIDSAAAAKVSTSYARQRALQDLHHDGISLRGLDAPGANLAQIELPEANLQGANLQGVILCGANLQRVDFRGANLRGADLQKANLKGVNLRGVNLHKANLRDAILTGASLQEANLTGASLRAAELWKAAFWGADLTDAELRWAELQGHELEGAKLCRTVLPDGRQEDCNCLEQSRR